MKKNVYLGAAYYPELWDESEVERDVARCKAIGINTLRVGEFAWGRMEPQEGVFDFSWLIRMVNIMHENGINTVMCTPSATPPRWMLDKYPQMLKVNSDLIRSDVSSRCHICKTDETIREKNRIIVTEMAKAFKDCKGIIGWQIDNEIFPYGYGCFCEHCKAAFRDYLKQKYGDIKTLNKEWGMSRWSLDYESFDAVQPPYPNQWRHPSLCTEWWAFNCRQIYSYVDEQAKILHDYGYKNVGTDLMMNNMLSVAEINKNLDVVQFNHYNSAAELPQMAFWYDFLRCIKDKPFWVTETQVGWNGSNYAEYGYRPIGNAYVNTIMPIAFGGEMNMYWLFRAHPNGHEIAHGSLYSTSGRLYRPAEEVKAAGEDLSKFSDILNTDIKSDIAIHYSSVAENNFKSAPMLKNFDYTATVRDKFHAAFAHYNTDVIELDHPLDGYKTLISPFVTTFPKDFRARVTEWIKKGGTWIVGPMSDIMTEYTSKFTDSPFSFLEELVGVYTKYQNPIDNDVYSAKHRDGRAMKVSMTFDAFEPLEGTNSLAEYDGGEFGGLSVVCERKIGKGSVILLGSVIDRKSLLSFVKQQPIAIATDNICLVKRSDGTIIALETENKSGSVTLDGVYYDVLAREKVSGTITVAPYTVHVFKPKGEK